MQQYLIKESTITAIANKLKESLGLPSTDTLSTTAFATIIRDMASGGTTYNSIWEAYEAFKDSGEIGDDVTGFYITDKQYKDYMELGEMYGWGSYLEQQYDKTWNVVEDNARVYDANGNYVAAESDSYIFNPGGNSATDLVAINQDQAIAIIDENNTVTACNEWTSFYVDDHEFAVYFPNNY